MGKLQVLPAQIANLIAAGEVVGRPASVVKELMENAVDAGATRILVSVLDAGRTLIQVTDNGCGMSPADAVLCFERHATSKIAEAADLASILTYGFRGEALPSIAAVADITLKTRRAQDETATKVFISEGSSKTSSVAAPIGSTFEVRNLFSNTPARRKFLKSDTIELKHITEEFTRIALTRPDIEFTLISNSREVFVLKKAQSLKFRILDLLGKNVVGDIVDVEAKTTLLTVSGFVGRPESARKTLGNQFFFVNGRYFRSPYLHKAVMKAYESLIPDGLTPSYFLFLETDPESVDVNIHPTKSEVKFEEESVVFQILYASVHETLGRNSFGASIDFDTEGAVSLPQLGSGFENYKGSFEAPSIEVDPTYNPFEDNFSAQGGQGIPSGFRQIPRAESCAPLFDEAATQLQSSAQSQASAICIQGKFVAVPSASGLMVVNVHRAWERILYERALKSLSGGAHVSQKALFPVQVQVGVSQRLLFDENAALLSSLGFEITPFGTDTVAVGAVPEGYSCEQGKVEQMVSDLVLILSDNAAALPEMMQSSMAAKFATLGSVNSESVTSPSEARRLLDTLFSCDNAEFSPSGKKTMLNFSVEELQNLFIK